MKKIFVTIILVSTFLSTHIAFGAGSISFIEQPLWFSSDTFTEGQTVSIYTALFNQEPSHLTGTISFYDRSVLLGEKQFTIKPRTVETLSFDWKVIPGEHVISITVAKLSRINAQGVKESISSTPITIESKKITVGNTPTQTEVQETLPTTATEVLNQVDNAQEKAASFIPAPIRKVAEAVFSGIEKFRSDTALAVSTNRNTLKSQIIDQEIKEAADSTGDNAIAKYEGNVGQHTVDAKSAFSKPFEQVRLFFLNLGTMFFSNKFLFYGISALFIYMGIRAIVLFIRSR